MPGVSQECSLSVDLPSDGNRFFDREMSRVRLIAKCTDDQCLDAFEQFDRFRGNEIRVRAIRKVTDPKTEHIEVRSVFHWNRGQRRPQDFERRSVDPLKFQFRRRSWMSFFSISERIAVGLSDLRLDRFGAKQRNRMAEPERKQTQVIESEDVVSVLVGVNHRMDDSHAFANQLGPQIRWRVNEQRSARQPDQDRASRALILRIRTLADVTVASDSRYADAGARSQESHDSGGRFSVGGFTVGGFTVFRDKQGGGSLFVDWEQLFFRVLDGNGV